MKKSYATLLILSGIIVLSLYAYISRHTEYITTNNFKPLRIAHAGGAINKQTYTNSYEALDSNLKKGFLYFELDFSFTKDDKLVCLHDWQHSFRRSFGYETNERVTLEEFKKLASEKSRFTKCTLDGLAEWLDKNPTAFIVTDVKENNVKALSMMHETLPEAHRRVIPQIYKPENFSQIKKIGYQQIIWTLYRYQGTDDQVLDWANAFFGSIAVTMPKNRTDSTLPTALQSLNIPTYVHTVNDRRELKKFITELGVSEIYTDYIEPIQSQ